MLEAILLNIAASVIYDLSKTGFTLLGGSKPEYDLELRKIIISSIEEYKTKYPIPKASKTPFYDSEILLTELLKFRFLRSFDQEAMLRTINTDNRLHQVSEKDLLNFLEIFDTNLEGSEKFRELAIDKNYKEEIFKIKDLVKNGFEDIEAKLGEKSDEILAAISASKVANVNNNGPVEKQINIDKNYGPINITESNKNSTSSKERLLVNPLPLTDFIPRTVVENLNDAYYSNTWSLNHGKNLLNLLNEHSKIALLGDVGIGKSTELIALHNQILEEGVFIPILVKLKNYKGQKVIDFKPILSIAAADQKKVVLLFDGLDEPNRENIEKATIGISNLIENYFPDSKIIISCRTSIYEDSLEEFKPYFLRDLFNHEAQSFAKKKLGSNGATFVTETYQKGLSDLLRIPFFLVKIIKFFEDKNHTIPNNKVELFDHLIKESIKTRLKRNTALSKDERGKLQIRCEELLPKLAFAMQCLSISSASKEQVFTIIGNHEDMDLLQKSSSLLEVNDGSWQFIHLNFQEYLAGKVLLGLNLLEIKNLIAIKELDYKVTNPSWSNTISFFVDQLNSGNKPELRKEIISWFKESDPQLFLNFESSHLTDEIMEQTVIQICSNHSDKNIWFLQSQNLHKLSSFIRTDKTYNFILNEVQSSKKLSIINAFVLLSHKEETTISRDMLIKINSVIWNILNGKESSVQILEGALNIYNKFTKKDEKNIRFLVTKYFHSIPRLRPALFRIIHKHNLQDEYIDKCVEDLCDEVNSGRVPSYPNPMVELVKHLKKESSVEKCMTFYAEKHEKVLDLATNEVFKTVLNSAAKLAPDSPIVFDSLKTIIEDSYLLRGIKINDPVKDFLEEADIKFKMFKSLFESEKELYFNLTCQLITLLDHTSIDYLADKFVEFKFGETEINDFRINLYRMNKELVPYFELKVNESRMDKISFGKLLTDDEISLRRSKQIKKQKNVLFNKEAFIHDVKIIFGTAEELSNLDFWKILDQQRTPGSFPEEYLRLNSPYTFSILAKKSRKGSLKKNELITKIQKHWECCFIIKEIDQFLEANKDAELEEQEKKFIKNWCDKKIKDGELNAFVAKQILKFNFVHYSDEVYLDLLSINLPSQKEIPLFDFAENVKKISAAKIKKRILKNLYRGIETSPVFINHVNYCIQKGITEAADLIYNYLEDKSWGNQGYPYQIIDAYFKLEGEAVKLENFLESTEYSEITKFYLAVDLINQNSPGVEIYLKKRFSSLSGELKVDYAELLLHYDNKEALIFFEQNMIKTNSSPFDITNKLNNLKSSSSVPHLLRLLKLSGTLINFKENGIKLDHHIYEAIRIIGLIDGNYYATKKHIDSFVSEQQLLESTPWRDEMLKILEQKAEYLKNLFLLKESKTPTIKDALNLFQKSTATI